MPLKEKKKEKGGGRKQTSNCKGQNERMNQRDVEEHKPQNQSDRV